MLYLGYLLIFLKYIQPDYLIHVFTIIYLLDKLKYINFLMSQLKCIRPILLEYWKDICKATKFKGESSFNFLYYEANSSLISLFLITPHNIYL